MFGIIVFTIIINLSVSLILSLKGIYALLQRLRGIKRKEKDRNGTDLSTYNNEKMDTPEFIYNQTYYQ